MMFFDSKKKYRGSARVVTPRSPAVSGLTVMDVVGADPDLVAFLTYLDRRGLMVQHPNTGHALFTFRWASGYQNGSDLKVQGMLEHI